MWTILILYIISTLSLIIEHYYCTTVINVSMHECEREEYTVFMYQGLIGGGGGGGGEGVDGVASHLPFTCLFVHNTIGVG